MEFSPQNIRPAERSRSAVLGMEVISIQEGANLGQVRQVLLDGKSYRVQGFLVERRKQGKEERILPFSAVHSFGEDSITIESQQMLERKGASLQYIRALRQPLRIIGTRAFTTDGNSLGKVEEFCFSLADGSITALEVAGSYFPEPMRIPGEDIIAIAPQTTMLKADAVPHAKPRQTEAVPPQPEALPQPSEPLPQQEAPPPPDSTAQEESIPPAMQEQAEPDFRPGDILPPWGLPGAVRTEEIAVAEAEVALPPMESAAAQNTPAVEAAQCE